MEKSAPRMGNLELRGIKRDDPKTPRIIMNHPILEVNMAIFPRIISISLACVSSICNRIGTSVPPSKPGRRRHLTWLEELLKNLHRHLRCVEQFEPNKMMEFCRNRRGVRDETASNFSILSPIANQFLFGFFWSSAPTLESLRSLL